jgi:hypothetical protein
MKRIIILVALMNLVLSGSAQEIGWEKESAIGSRFEMDWMYFRMLKNPLIPDNEKYVDNSRANPYRMFIPEKMRKEDYRADIKIRKWGETKAYRPNKVGHNEYLEFYANEFYLVEKKEGYTGIKRSFMTDSIIDVIHLNIYDSIFPYDNRFLAILKEKTKTGDYRFTFHSGNVTWGEWRDVHYIRRVDYCGYIRGAQFGIENVFKFRQDFSDKIRQFRPEFPNYVYTCNRWESLLTKRCVIIGAPEGKEDQLVEYIYYSNLPEKTGDTDKTHYYEMRYILPTQITSIKERRLEKRRLTDEEQTYIFGYENEMYPYIERKTEPEEEIESEE